MSIPIPFPLIQPRRVSSSTSLSCGGGEAGGAGGDGRDDGACAAKAMDAQMAVPATADGPQ